ncbi:hypothetical protein AXG93_4485s1110 [Marchantia polymorpha subsp. ruderalis]|uniref:Uncharacterized protein n=1 Tax=Marchantia polymorpha subsp. ruderalis TaxID=1480154 RepID=A0A176WGA3_MARPO|nr:hypothetical protein AXG93_4485s1110 [Marchantia polymorpha subsp. ruderalis]
MTSLRLGTFATSFLLFFLNGMNVELFIGSPRAVFNTIYLSRAKRRKLERVETSPKQQILRQPRQESENNKFHSLSATEDLPRVRHEIKPKTSLQGNKHRADGGGDFVGPSAGLQSFYSESMPAVEKMSASASVRTEALAEAKNSQLQATEIAGVKTVARRGSPGRTNGVSRACASMPTLVTAAVVMVVVNLAAALS